MIQQFSKRAFFRKAAHGLLISVAALATDSVAAQPFIEPGRSDIRVALQQLADDDVIQAPISAWPISWQSIAADIEDADRAILSAETRAALDRIETELNFAEQTQRFLPHVRIGAANDPVAVRSFASTPRDQGELEGGISYTGNAVSFNLNVIRAWDSTDDWRLDGSYAAFATKQWSFVAGYPERWWGPGMQGSLILSTNARPIPQLSVQRLSADGFSKKWLSWLGPWTVTSFLGQLDDTRVVNDALLFGARFSARPLPQLEFALSRAAQLCGDGRSCGFSDFGNMLIGKDNKGRNVSADAEPGNQLAGFDGRWSFRARPLAVYWQWIGEDSRQGGPQIGSWMRMIGGEFTGALRSPNWRQRTYIEMTDTTCQTGGLGFGGDKFNCAYEHSTFSTGYRYEKRTLGYTTDTDSESLSIISVLTGPKNQVFELAAYSVRVNQGPLTNPDHSLSTTPASRYGLDLSHLRDLPIGQLRVRLSLAEQRNQLTGVTDSDSGIAVEWLLGYW